MAPSHMENEYTHKKFNCGYSHKKLGLRLVRRDSQEENQIDQEINNNQMETQERTSSPTLFRPYALNEDHSNCNQEATLSQQHHTAVSQEDLVQYFAQHYSQQQSPDAYALKLQRQRAALYMKHVMQYYETGNGWPSMHPNALQQQIMAYNNTQQHC